CMSYWISWALITGCTHGLQVRVSSERLEGRSLKKNQRTPPARGAKWWPQAGPAVGPIWPLLQSGPATGPDSLARADGPAIGPDSLARADGPAIGPDSLARTAGPAAGPDSPKCTG